MKNNIIKYLASAALALGMVSAVQATAITGDIAFTGIYTQNGGTYGNLATATSMTIMNTVANPVIVNAATGDLAGSGAPITFATPIGVNGNAPSLIGLQLWSATKGPITYSLLVTSEAQTFTSGNQLNLSGTGIIRDGNAADNTAGVWQLSFGASGNLFIWQSMASAKGPPAIVAQPVNQTVSVGGTATFSLTAVGAMPLSYFWRRNGTPIAGATASSYTTNNVQLADSGSQFSCLVSNAYQTVLSSNAILAVPLVVTNNIFISAGVQVSWSSETNANYQVQRASNVDTNSWTNLDQLIRGNGSTNYFFEPFGNPSQMFYRVVQIP